VDRRARIAERRGAIGNRISLAVTRIVRSWRFLGIFLVFTAVWWTFVGPLLDDSWPYVGYTTVISLGTWIDLIIVGIGQRLSDERDDEMKALLLQLIERIGLQADDIQHGLADLGDE